MLKRAGCLFLMFFLVGCAVTGRDFPVTPIKDIQPNVTTKKQIFNTFGEPVEKGLDTGLETWTYLYTTVGTGSGFVSKKHLYVVFNKDDTVRSYSFSSD